MIEFRVNGVKSMASVSISLRGDKNYRDAIGIVAKRHGKDAGEIVRESLDQCFGAEILEALSFFAPIVDSNQRQLDVINDEARLPHV